MSEAKNFNPVFIIAALIIVAIGSIQATTSRNKLRQRVQDVEAFMDSYRDPVAQVAREEGARSDSVYTAGWCWISPSGRHGVTVVWP